MSTAESFDLGITEDKPQLLVDVRGVYEECEGAKTSVPKDFKAEHLTA